jgi:capping protein alpha
MASYVQPHADVRVIVDDDAGLEEGVLPALREYNLTQFTTVDVPGEHHQVGI